MTQHSDLARRIAEKCTLHGEFTLRSGAISNIYFDKYLFGEFMQVYHRQGGLWSMDDTSDLVWNTWTGLRFPLVLGFVASTEMQVEYDSGAADEADDLDTTYSLKLGYAW